MVATTYAAGRPDWLDVASGDLVLRICGGPRDGQAVRLKSSKCSIGAGPHCTLRLRAGGVAPLHCLIVRGPAGAVVRRWAADTRLNRQAFTDAALSPGDHLGIGPIELEVVSVGAETATEKSSRHTPFAYNTDGVCEPQSASDARSQLERESLEAERRRLDELATGLQGREAWLAEQNEQTGARLAELETQRQAMEQQRQQWQAEQSQTRASLDAEREQFSARLAELETQQKALAEDRRQWESQRSEAAADGAKQTEQVAARLVEIDTQRQAMEQQWQAEQNQARAGLDAEREQLSARLVEIDTQRQAMERERQRWQAEQSEAQRSLDDQRRELAAGLAELEAQRNAVAEQRSQWEQQRAELAPSIEPTSAPAGDKGDSPIFADAKIETVSDAEQPAEPRLQEPEFEAPAEEAPVNLAEVLRRVGAKIETSEAEPARSESVARSESPRENARPRPTVGPVRNEGEEESIEDYMSRLMQRMRTASGESGVPAYTPQQSDSPRPASELPSLVQPPKPQPSASLAASERSEPVEISLRRVAPEKHVDLSALRELANLSAQSALNRHSRHMLVRTMYSKLMVAAVALACGGALFWMWQALGALQMTFYSALMAILVAIYWGVEYALLTGRLIISKSGHIDIDWNVSPHGKPAAPPAEEVAEPPATVLDESPAESARQ